VILAAHGQHIEGDVAGGRSGGRAARSAPGHALLQVVKAQPTVGPHHGFPVQYGAGLQVELGGRGQVGKGAGQVSAATRPQFHGVVGAHRREPVAIKFDLVDTAARARGLGRDDLGRTGHSQLHRPCQVAR
jgi:hypothetical protein